MRRIGGLLFACGLALATVLSAQSAHSQSNPGSSPWSVPHGGTGRETLTLHGVLLGQGASPIGYTAAMTDGQLLVGQTGADPLPKTIAGDVTINAAGTTAIGANKVTNAMLRQSGALSLIGRSANSTGDVADVQASAGSSCAFRENGSTIGCGTLATAAYAANSVTNAKLAQMANNTVKCRVTAGTGDPEDCTATQGRSVLGLGTAATQNTGTSGANVPLLDGNNVHSGTQDFQAAVKLSSFVTSTQITAAQNDYTATDGSNTCSTKQTLRISSDASRNITGLSCGQAEGDVRIIHNVGAQDIVLTNQDAASTAANRFLLGGDTTLGADTSITVRYDGVASRWRAITTPGAGGGGGGVTSVAVAAGSGIETSGTCTITTSGTCTVAVSAARRTLPTTQVFTSGSGTYTTPANVLWIEVELVGAGGGGGGGGTGGGSAGGAGGATCWDTSGAACTTPLYQASGGSGGSGPGQGDGGAGGGVAGSGTCLKAGTGNGGAGPGDTAAATYPVGQAGGGSAFRGGGARATFGAGTAGATNTGGGGGGGGQLTASSYAGGGGGGGGGCYVIINSPAATYTYAVGAAGSAGTAGTSGNAGGAGGSGHILVIEHYGT